MKSAVCLVDLMNSISLCGVQCMCHLNGYYPYSATGYIRNVNLNGVFLDILLTMTQVGNIKTGRWAGIFYSSLGI